VRRVFRRGPVIAQQKGVNILDRGSQVHAMAAFQELLAFSPAPKLGVDGKLNPKQTDAAEMRGQQLFFGKASCVECHQAPYYSDNLMHSLQTERFFRRIWSMG
jgi:cytochrome c peroxidase